MSVPPWVYGPFELLVHAELHYREGGDFDRRIALISFDNSIEVSVMNYLSLDDIHRGGRKYKREEKSVWMDNYFSTKLDFIEEECKRRSKKMLHDKQHMTWYHQNRNKQYHEGQAAVPTSEVLNGAREAAIWVFGFLYDVPNVLAELDARISELNASKDLPEQDDELDKLIDEEFGTVRFGDMIVYSSELLFAYDPIAYRAKAIELSARRRETVNNAL